jgi:hypothetical protein
MQTVVETSIFRRRADKLLSEDERRALIDFLAWNPDAGHEIQAPAASGRCASRPRARVAAAAFG